MVKSNLSGKYEVITLERKDGSSVGKRTLVVQGQFEDMCVFYEALKDAMESSVNADVREKGFTNSAGANIGYEESDLMNWRTDRKEIAAYDRAKASAKRYGYLRFAAEESRFTYDGDPYSWLSSLNAEIAATGIEVESEPLAV